LNAVLLYVNWPREVLWGPVARCINEIVCVVILTSLQNDVRAIDVARRRNHMEVVQLLLQSGAQVCTQ